MGNNVNHPDHYQNIAGVEAIDILNDVVKDLPGKQAAMLWNTLKYLLRFQKKNGVEDLKKARNYLDYLINDIDADKNIQENTKPEKNDSEVPWDAWYSDEYGDVVIYSKSHKLNGRPSKLSFDTGSAAEEFLNVFHNMIKEGYDEFSIADVAVKMKFKTAKDNSWNKWDEPVNWKEELDYSQGLPIVPVWDKYELTFRYKDERFRIYEKDERYILEFVYKDVVKK